MAQKSNDRKHSTYAEKTTIWAHFGYAIMKCQVLEHRLADILFMCQMLNGDKAWADKSASVPHYQKMTMGWLKNRICEATTLPPVLHDNLKEVCEIRNELAHRFFKQRINLLLRKEGYEKLVHEIEGMYGKIEDVINAFHTINVYFGKPLGYSDEAIGRVSRDFANYFASLPDDEKKKIEDIGKDRYP